MGKSGYAKRLERKQLRDKTAAELKEAKADLAKIEHEEKLLEAAEMKKTAEKHAEPPEDVKPQKRVRRKASDK